MFFVVDSPLNERDFSEGEREPAKQQKMNGVCARTYGNMNDVAAFQLDFSRFAPERTTRLQWRVF